MRSLSLLLLASLSFFTKAQTNSQSLPADTSQAYTFISALPVFKTEVYPDFTSYIKKNIHYPKDARANKIQGKVHVSYIIEADGSVSNVTIVNGKSLYPSCDAEVIRLISSSPKWTPGSQNGVPCRVKMVNIITFSL